MSANDAFVVGAGGAKEPAHGFIGMFVAELERGMMHGQEMVGAEGAEHGPHLFGRGVGVFPGVVGADAENRQPDRFERIECVRDSGVASIEDAVSVVFEEVGVDAASAVEHHARPPVGWLESLNRDTVIVQLLAAGEFDDIIKAGGNEPAGAFSRDDGCSRAGKAPECWAVKMIEVSVGDEDKVDGRELRWAEGKGQIAPDADGAPADSDADAIGEDGVGEYPPSADMEKRGGMAEPNGAERVGGGAE